MTNNYQQLLRQATLELKKHQLDDHAGRLLLAHLMGIELNQLPLYLEQAVDEKVQIAFKRDLKELLKGVPVQHLMGFSYFYGVPFKVTPEVLIPRKETEELVESVIDYIQKDDRGRSISILDLGTGSGAIAITLKKQFPKAVVYASDVSKTALQIARYNAEMHHTKIHWLTGNWLNPILDQGILVDIIVSNPPYIKENEPLSKITLHDPHRALFGGKDGLDAYRQIFKSMDQVLKPGGLIALEIGYDQKDAILDLVLRLAKNHYHHEVKCDLQGHDRIVLLHDIRNK